MKIQDLMEAYVADALPDLIHHAKSLIIMYSQTLPDIVKKYDFTVTDPYDPNDTGLANRAIRGCKLQVGSTRAIWFTNNYLSVRKDRADKGMGGGKTSRGLKNALVALSEVPHLRKVDGLQKIAHLNVNINPTQRLKGDPDADILTYGELMGDIETNLPKVIRGIAKIAHPHEVETTFLDKEEIYGIGDKLEHVIKQWYSLAHTIPKPYEGGNTYKQKGDALVVDKRGKASNSNIVKPEEKPKKQDTHSQNMNAAQQAINQGFELLKKNGISDHELHTIRQKVQKSDNQLLALMQVFQKFGINPNALMEAWLNTY